MEGLVNVDVGTDGRGHTRGSRVRGTYKNPHCPAFELDELWWKDGVPRHHVSWAVLCPGGWDGGCCLLTLGAEAAKTKAVGYICFKPELLSQAQSLGYRVLVSWSLAAPVLGIRGKRMICGDRRSFAKTRG